MVAIFIGTIAVNAMNDYTGSLSLQAAGFKVKRIYSAALVAILGFLFTLVLQYGFGYFVGQPQSGAFAGNFFNFLLFISYWISPFVGVVLADWWLRGQKADANSVVDYAKLHTGTIGLVALVVGFAVGIPFQASSLGYAWSVEWWGVPFNWVTANYLHGADLAYYVGGGVAFLIYWFGARGMLKRT
jgi:NCS1 family nucleobase:cation symporter-1